MSYEIPEHPLSANPLSAVDRHQFFVGRLKHVPFAVQEVVLPSIRGQVIAQPTPFTNLNYPGSGLEWGPLQVTILVDEYLLNYKELYRWMVGIFIPTHFDEAVKYNTEERARRGPTTLANIQVSDAILTMLDNNRLPTVRFHFRDVYPTELGAVTFATTTSGVDYAKTTVIFQYATFDVVDVAAPPST